MKLQYNDDGNPFVMWGENKIELDKDPLSDIRDREKAERELRETPENVESALRELKELLKGEKNLLVPIDNDDFLMKFLRPCKFYPDSAFQKIKNYYKFRQSHKEYCRDLMPSMVRDPFDYSVVSILAPRDQHGRRILFVECGERWNHRQVPVGEVFRGIQVGLESAMVEPRTQVHGVIAIMDMKGLSLSQVLQFTPPFAKMLVDWIQDCAPIRLKALHIINQPYVFNMLYALFRPFLREKLRSRIFFHGSNKESLLKHVNPEVLRQRHGGCLPDPDIPGPVLWEMLHHYEDSFKLANSYGYAKK